MKIKTLIDRLNKLQNKFGNIEVVIDFDENGWYKPEEVRYIKEDYNEDEYEFINIRSSNES